MANFKMVMDLKYINEKKLHQFSWPGEKTLSKQYT